MSLGQLQREFARDVPRLIDKAHELGFAVTLGDAFRDKRSHGKVGERIAYGNAFSCHKIKCALDLNLFRWDESKQKWIYCTETEDHRELGEWWEKQAEENCWGGRFNDGNHYSKTYQGMK